MYYYIICDSHGNFYYNMFFTLISCNQILQWCKLIIYQTKTYCIINIMLCRENSITVPDCIMCRLQTTDYRLQTTDYRLRTTDYGLRTTDYGLRTTDYGLRTTDYGLHVCWSDDDIDCYCRLRQL